MIMGLKSTEISLTKTALQNYAIFKSMGGIPEACQRSRRAVFLRGGVQSLMADENRNPPLISFRELPGGWLGLLAEFFFQLPEPFGA